MSSLEYRSLVEKMDTKLAQDLEIIQDSFMAYFK